LAKEWFNPRVGGLIFFFIRSLNFLKNLFSKTSFRSLEYFLVFGSFWLMLVPAVMSAEGTPHGLRLLGCLPWLMIMAGWFLIAIFNYLWQNKERWVKILAVSILVLVVVGVIFIDLWGYWYQTANNQEYYYAFRQDLTYASDYLNQRNDKENTYLALDEYSLQTTEYLTSANNQPYQVAALDRLDQLRLKKGQAIVFTSSSLGLADFYQIQHPEVELLEVMNNPKVQLEEGVSPELIRVYGRQ